MDSGIFGAVFIKFEGCFEARRRHEANAGAAPTTAHLGHFSMAFQPVRGANKIDFERASRVCAQI